VGDCAAERPGLGALRIGMDPLAVERRFGKLVDAILGDLVPVRGLAGDTDLGGKRFVGSLDGLMSFSFWVYSESSGVV
jgi:hypothetical protein